MDKNWIGERLEEIDISRIDSHLQYFCGMERLSGEPEAQKTVEYIAESLKREGIACEIEEFDAYLSNPIESSLTVDGEQIPSRPRSFSANCGRLEAELVYDRGTKEKDLTPLEQEAFYRTIKGKIVIGYGFDERYAKVLEQYGAAAWIQVWTSPEPQIHEDTVSPVWGTPDMDSCFLRLNMPVLAVAGPDGEKMIGRLECAGQAGKRESTGRPGAGLGVSAVISSKVDTGVKKVLLPVAKIPGKQEDFLLLSGHYDTWYVGAFDNGTANAAALELARLLHQNRDKLERSVRIAWWPGHSNGRYMGSAWYCDHHWKALKDLCFAHVNMDLLGSKGTDDTLAVRTSGLEGEQWLHAVTALADPRAQLVTGRIGRGADQSFWGADVAYHINPRYEARPERKTSTAPGPGVYWWHTSEDTYDKLDLDTLKKDTRVVYALVLALVTQQQLPADFEGYFELWDGYLKKLEENPEQTAGIHEIRDALHQAEECCLQIRKRNAGSVEAENRLRILTGGIINRLMHSSGTPYEQDTAFAYGPLHLLGASGRLRRENSPADWHLFYQTTFIRQKNRMVTELEELSEKLRRLDS